MAAWIRNPASNYSTLTLTMEVTLSTLPMSSKYHNDTFLSHSIIMNSQDGSSERFIGEWAEERGIRDKLFIATKACQ